MTRVLVLSLLSLALGHTLGAPTEYIRRAQEDNATLGDSWQGIVGGDIASSGEFPFFAAFVPLVQCGGSLIAPDRVLTAAHCVVGGAPISVRIGPSTLSDGEEIDVTCAQYHPDYYVGFSGVRQNICDSSCNSQSALGPIHLVID